MINCQWLIVIGNEMNDLVYKKVIFRICLIALAILCIDAHGQKAKDNTLDKEIQAMVKEISSDSMKNYIAKMVSFGTRHSFSDTVSATTGIGAARRWVASKFLQFRKQSGASMSVVLDPCEILPGGRNARVPRRVIMKNVVATLKGTDPNDNRVLLVSGHLDSRNSNGMDSVALAPGANDDASGVAVVLELARLMSKRKFPCSIVFVAVQGEEQGLLGARCMAERFRSGNVNLVAMLNNDIVGNSVASETGNRNDKTVRIFSEMIPAAETDEEKKSRESLKSENDSPSRQLARYIREVAEPYAGGFTATVNMRPDLGLDVNDPLIDKNYVSNFPVDVFSDTSLTDCQQLISKALKQQKHWGTWWWQNLGRFLPVSAIEIIAKRNLQDNYYAGAFSNLGNWTCKEQNSNISFFVNPLLSHPIGAGAIIWNGQLNITLRVYPTFPIVQSELDRLIAAWAKAI